MGCLNSDPLAKDRKWFSNIHFSGPCNRACYFCIGQHMMELDPLNNLDTYPLANFDEFISEVNSRGITDVNLTGTNTDPSLYQHLPELVTDIRSRVKNSRVGIRTNGVLQDYLYLFDNISVSIPTFDWGLYKELMGKGNPPYIGDLPMDKVKVNMVLSSKTKHRIHLDIAQLLMMGVKRINLREPYGQPHVGNPIPWMHEPDYHKLGMPVWKVGECEIMYWDVHYVLVESVNLYANGKVSMDYPITRGHSLSDKGMVKDQSNWEKEERHTEQWVKIDRIHK